MSDVHGEYELFCELLQKISFSSEDTLIICGDIIEKGPHSVRLAKLIFSCPNVTVIRGNHEEAFVNYYTHLMRYEDVDFDMVLNKLREYVSGEDGHELDWDTIDRIEELPYYYETEDFICIHTGVPLESDGRIPPLKSVMLEELLYSRRFKLPEVLPRDSRCLFTVILRL